jgi:uncharacterized membrane protein (DUF4010 family)
MIPLPESATQFAVALGIGLLIGVERERNKGLGPDRSAAGVRTFMLLALAGALADRIGDYGILIAGVFVSLLVWASYRRTRDDDPGLTTEMAMLVTFFLGLMAMRSTALAAGLGVLVVAVLASKSRLHHLVREALTEQELHDLLLLLASAFVVLPLLPDGPIDPWEAVNLRRLWLLVVAVMAVSSAGYLALRAFGSRLGLVLAGLGGGFVSSIATIAAMADRAKAAPGYSASFASAGLASNVGTTVQLAVVLGALSPALLQIAAWPLVASGLVAVGAALISSFNATSSPEGQQDLAGGKRPFEPMRVLGFVAIVAVVILLANIAQHQFGQASLPWVLAASGLADVHAAGASAAQLVASGHVQARIALLAMVAALASNSLVKCLVALRGGADYARRTVPGIVLMVFAFALTAWWVAGRPG